MKVTKNTCDELPTPMFVPVVVGAFIVTRALPSAILFLPRRVDDRLLTLH